MIVFKKETDSLKDRGGGAGPGGMQKVYRGRHLSLQSSTYGILSNELVLTSQM